MVNGKHISVLFVAIVIYSTGNQS